MGLGFGFNFFSAAQPNGPGPWTFIQEFLNPQATGALGGTTTNVTWVAYMEVVSGVLKGVAGTPAGGGANYEVVNTLDTPLSSSLELQYTGGCANAGVNFVGNSLELRDAAGVPLCHLTTIGVGGSLYLILEDHDASVSAVLAIFGSSPIELRFVVKVNLTTQRVTLTSPDMVFDDGNDIDISGAGLDNVGQVVCMILAPTGPSGQAGSTFAHIKVREIA